MGICAYARLARRKSGACFMKVYLAADHAGFEAKETLKKFLQEKGYDIQDQGASALDLKDDYPDVMKKAASLLSTNPGSVAFLFGGSGQGEAMVANREKGVRAAVYYGGPKEIVVLSKEHNNANALSFGARFLSTDQIVDAALLWLETKFSNDPRHARRVRKIDG